MFVLLLDELVGLKKQVSIIAIFILLNLLVGRLFQESLGLVCFSELAIVALTGFAFWNAMAGRIKAFATGWNENKNTRQLLFQGGIGISVAAANILLGQLVLVFLITMVYNCTSASFSIVNASLTNNIAVNLFCYFSLLFFFIKDQAHHKKSNTTKTIALALDKIEVSRGSSKLLLEPKQIFYIQASNNCIVLHTQLGRFVKYQSLKSVQTALEPYGFKRVHRSFLVNTNTIKKVYKNKNGDGILYLQCGASVRFSRTYQKYVP